VIKHSTMFKIEKVPEAELASIFNSHCPDPKHVVLKDIYPILNKNGIHVLIVCILPELGYNPANQIKIFKKLGRIDEKIQSSFESSFFLEWLSLMLLKVEFWLRVYLLNKDKYADKNVLTDALSFGILIKECRNSGMKKELLSQIQLLNKHRIQYIHNYLKNDFDYEDVKSQKDNFDHSIEDLVKYVKENAYRIIQDPVELDMLDNTIGFVELVRLSSR
jgi:hypothetical protein